MNKVIDKGFRGCRFVSTIVKHPVLQHQLLPRLAYFQSSSFGQNNIIMTAAAKLVSEYQLNLQKHINFCCCCFKIDKETKICSKKF